MSYTNRARVMLALSPLWVPVVLVLNLADALFGAAKDFAATTADDARFWWFDVYRVARHGSVQDAALPATVALADAAQRIEDISSDDAGGS